MSGNMPRRNLRITLADCLYHGDQVPVLLIGVRRFIFALEFNANRKVITFRTATKTLLSGMPSTTFEWHELNQVSIATNQQVR